MYIKLQHKIWFFNLVLVLWGSLTAMGQTLNKQEKVTFTTGRGKTKVTTNEEGQLIVNVSPKAAQRIQSNGVVRYPDFGAEGDGKTDDIDAIAAAHAYANLHHLPVKAADNATYYISGKDRTAIIQTQTDFGTAQFIINDTHVQNRNAPVFKVQSGLQPFRIDGISSLRRNQEKIDIALPGPCLVAVTDDNKMRFIRLGRNQNGGHPQTDIFMVDNKGNVNTDTPIIWDFDQISNLIAIPIDSSILRITGGYFTTIANKADSKYTYYSRGIAIGRSNVIVDGVRHYVVGEGDHGAPYGGFISIRDCANVTVRNAVFTGHKVYETIGSSGLPVDMGSYDISLSRSLYVSFINCSQTNDINDVAYWGIMHSDYCKNIVFDKCTLSRFDAHMGVANTTIRNSTLGHQGINIIGRGILTVENTTIHRGTFVNLRGDYGSTWEGEFHVRNCVLKPVDSTKSNVSLISGSNSGQHDFGYSCYMPERIIIENLYIDDSNHSADYQGPAIFGNFNPKLTDETYKSSFCYHVPREVILNNVTTASGKPLRLCDNMFMFRNVNIIYQ